MPAPLIGISSYEYFKPENGWRYDISYWRNAAALEKAGGLPVLIPSSITTKTLHQVYQRLDAVLLPGGGDIDPQHYHTSPDADLVGVNAARDTMELSLAAWAIQDDLPIFGICRGIQLLNVALGGSLVQDIPSQIQTTLRHDILEGEPRNTILHDIQIAEDSRLSEILGSPQLSVNSLHHQAIKNLAPSAIATAHAPDGIIEALEVPDKTFMLAVQWHPEDLAEQDERMQALFVAFVEAARQNMK